MSLAPDCSQPGVNKQQSQRCVLVGRQRSEHPSCRSSRLCQGGASESWNRPAPAWAPGPHAAATVRLLRLRRAGLERADTLEEKRARPDGKEDE